MRPQCWWVQLEVRATLQRPSIRVVSEPRAVATGSYAQLSKKLHFAGYCVIRSLPLAVLTRLVATLTFNYTQCWFASILMLDGVANDWVVARAHLARDSRAGTPVPLSN